MGFFDKLGFGKQKETSKPAATEKDVVPVDEARQALLDERTRLMKDLKDFKDNNFGGGISAKIKALQKQVDQIDEQLIATLPTPEDAIARGKRAKTAGEMVDRRMVEKPEAMKAAEGRASERKALMAEQKALRQQKIDLLKQMDETERNIVLQKNVIDDQRLGFHGSKKVGSVAEGAVGINESFLADLQKQLVDVDSRIGDLDAKLKRPE